MLDVTVKTLDGKNTPFTVDENMTVKNFKDHISGAIAIPSDQQRIIFKGKVLQDEAKLADSDVAGKVVHVVLRPPPSTSSPAGSSSAAGTAAAAPPGRRPAAASSQPRRAAQPTSGTSVMVASFSLPGDMTDTRHISSIVENVMRGIGPNGGVHVHSRSDPVSSVAVHIDLREAPHDAHAGSGFPRGGAQSGRGAEQLSASQSGFLGGAEPRRCLQQIQGFVSELNRMIDGIEHLHVDRAAGVDSNTSTGSAPRRPESSRPAEPVRPNAHDDGTGRVPVSSLAEVLSQIAAVTSRLQPLIELYSNRVRECAAAPVSREATSDPQASAPSSDLAQAHSESSATGGGGQRPAEMGDRDWLLFDRTAEAMHTLGHVLHNASDLMVEWSLPPTQREVVVVPMLGMPALMFPRGPIVVPAGVATQSNVLAPPATQPEAQSRSAARASGSSDGASQRGLGQPPTNTTRLPAASSHSGGQQQPPPAQFMSDVQMPAGVPPVFFVQLGIDQVAPQPGQAPLPTIVEANILTPQNVQVIPPSAFPSGAAFMPFGFGPAPPASAASPAGNVTGPAASQPPSAPPAGQLPGPGTAQPGLQFFASGAPPFAFLPQQLQDMVRHFATVGSQQPAGQPPVANPGQRAPAAAAASGSTASQPPPLLGAGLPQVAVLPPVVLASGHAFMPPITMHVPLGPPVVVPLQPAHPPLQPPQQPPASQQQEATPARAAGTVTNSGSHQPAAQRNPPMNTAVQLLGGRHGSAHQADMYLPCNSVFWHPSVMPIVRQLNSTHLPPTSAGSAAGVADSRSTPRSNLSAETVRGQLHAREGDNVAATQFHTMLSAIVNSFINRAMRPSGSGGSATAGVRGTSAASTTVSDAPTSTTGGARTASAHTSDGAATTSSQAHQSRPAGAGDASGLPAPELGTFDSTAFSSVLPAAIEQLAAFASFVAEPPTADSRPATANSGGTSSNPLPDDMFVQLMTAVAQEVTSGYSSERPSTIQDFLQRMASSHGLFAESPTTAAAGIIHSAFNIISQHLTFADFQRLYNGDPSCLDLLRSPLSAFIRSHVLDDGPTTDENVSAAVDRLVEEWGPHFATDLVGVETVDDIDLFGTVKQFIRTHLKRLMRLILTPPGARSAPSMERSFGSQLDSLVRDSVLNLCQLLLHCVGNDVEALLQCIRTHVEALFSGASNAVVGLTSSLITSQVRSMISQLHVSSSSAGEDRVQPYLVKRSHSDPAAATQQSDHSQLTSTSQALVQPSVEGDRLVPGREDDSSNYESADESGPEMEIPNTEATQIGTIRSEESRAVASAPERLTRGIDDSSNPMDVAASAGDTGITRESTRTPSTVASPADDWRSQVPQDWVPVIECDQRRQSEASASGGSGNVEQQTFSDAYLSGVPAKKRKIVTTKEEPGPASSSN